MPILGWLASVALAALLLGYFQHQAIFGSSDHGSPPTYAYPWHAGWIRGLRSSSRETCFRKAFYVQGTPKSGYLAVAADNTYLISVNDKPLSPTFTPNLSGSFIGGAGETPNCATGIPRFYRVAQVYDLTPYLTSGKNVVAVNVQTDDVEPRLLVDGTVHADTDVPIRSDPSWRCNFKQESHNELSWTSPAFRDSKWPLARVAEGPTDLPTDGQVAAIDSSFDGRYIGSPTSQKATSTTFATVVDCKDEVNSGWLRVTCDVPFELSLNGRTIYGNAIPNRGLQNYIAQYKHVDVLPRESYAHQNEDHPLLFPTQRVALFTLENALAKGKNLLSITLHPYPSPVGQELEQFYLDGSMTYASGSRAKITTGSNWKVVAVSGKQAELPVSQFRLAHTLFPVSMGPKSLVATVTSGGIGLRQISVYALAYFCLAMGLVYGVASVGTGSDRFRRCLSFGGLASCVTACLLGSLFLAQIVSLTAWNRLYLASPEFGSLCLKIGIGVWLVVFLERLVPWNRFFVKQTTKDGKINPRRKLAFLPVLVGACALLAILLIAIQLDTRGLAINAFVNDEYVTILCVKGILHTGKPLFEVPGILYGRSALYHYLLAPFAYYGFLYDKLWITRLLSCVWHVATILIVYRFGKDVLNRWAGLAAAAIVAFSPGLVFFARETRFYEQYAFFTTLTVFLLWHSLHRPESVWLKVGFVLAFTGAYESQELVMTLLPGIMIVLWIAGQGRGWLKLPVILSVIFFAAVIYVDLDVYFHHHTTPLPNVDIYARSLIGFHIDNLDVAASLVFSGYDRTEVPLGVIFFIGLVWFGTASLRSPRAIGERRTVGWPSFFVILILSGLVASDFLVPITGYRYLIHLVPLLALFDVFVVITIVQYVSNGLQRPTTSAVTGGIVFASAAFICIYADHPLEMWNATTRCYNRDHTAAIRFVAEHKMPGDATIIMDPQAALVEMNSCDYYWTSPLKSIYKYQSPEGKLRERNSGAICIDNSEKLQRLMVQYKRLWLVTLPMSSDPIDTVPNDGGVLQVGTFAMHNLVHAYDARGVQVWLWDRSYGHFHPNYFGFPLDDTKV